MKAIGVLIIGLGLILIVIGVQGTQSQVLADMKQLNPKLRTATDTSNANTPGSTVQRAGTTPGGPNPETVSAT